VLNAGQEHDNFLDAVPSNAVMYADGSGSVLDLNASTSLQLDSTQLADVQPVPTFNYYEAPAPHPEIYASNGGLVNVAAPVIQLGGGIFSVGAGSIVNVSATTIYDSGSLMSGVGGTLNIGSLANPVQLLQSGGIVAWDLDPTGLTHGDAASYVHAFVSDYSGQATSTSKITDTLVAYDGGSLSLMGQTYLGGMISVSPNSSAPILPFTHLTITETTSAEGLGNIVAFSGEIDVSAHNHRLRANGNSGRARDGLSRRV